MKRRFTQKEVARITHMGAPAASSGMAASCELPANTSKVISTASKPLMPDLAMATPVIRPQAARPGATLAMSFKPRRNSGCLNKAVKRGSFQCVRVVCRCKNLTGVQRKAVQKVGSLQRLAAGFLQPCGAQHA